MHDGETSVLAKDAKGDEIKQIQGNIVEGGADRRHELTGPYRRLVDMELEIECVDTLHELQVQA